MINKHQPAKIHAEIKLIFNDLRQNCIDSLHSIDNLLTVQLLPKYGESLLLLAIGIAIFGVFYMAFFHIPGFFYDESNTLRIATLPFNQISEVLKLEQNFTPYYYFLHLLFSAFGPSYKIAVFFNVFIWILSGSVFYALTQELFGSQKKRLFVLLFYLVIPMIYCQAFYVRMYALINLASLLYYYALFSLTTEYKPTKVILMAVAMILFALLHPSSLIFLGVVFIIHFFVLPKKTLVVVQAATLFAISLSVYQIIQKSGLLDVYFYTGLEYALATPSAFYDAFQKLFYLRETTSNIFVYILSMIAIALFYKRYDLSEKKNLVIAIFCGAFIALHLFFPDFIGRHFWFLIIPVLLAMCLGLFSLKSKTVIYAACLIILLGQSMLFFEASAVQYAYDNQDRFCTSLQQAKDGPIFTDFSAYNFIVYCHLKTDGKVYSISSKGLHTLSGLSTFEVLKIQAKLGGSIIWTIDRNQAANALNQMSIPEKAQLQKDIQDTLQGYDKAYFSFSPFEGDNAQILEDEMALFGHKLHLIGYLNPGIYVFEVIQP